ncbi:MAG: YHS domain-containing (seleno)protein [Methyloligellaceae bacterium]
MNSFTMKSNDRHYLWGTGFLVGLFLLMAAATQAFAGTSHNANNKGLAIKGADPVAYFVDKKYVAGNKQFSHQWEGATWYFASAENRDRFISEPAKYAPQYGGWCAYAVARGSLAPVDPKAWTIHDGKLYLNFSKRVQSRWMRDVPGEIQKADANWPTVKPKTTMQ